MDRLDLFLLWIGLPLWAGGMLTLIVLLYQISQLLRKILETGAQCVIAPSKDADPEKP